MTNRINGDFNSETMEAFRAAYANRMATPEDLEIDSYTNLPTDIVSNVSPWISHTGLWRANPGQEKDFVPNQELPPSNLEDFEDSLLEQEVNSLVEGLLGEISSEEDDELDNLADILLEAEDDEDFQDLVDAFLDDDEDLDEDGFDEEEVDNLLQELLNSDEEEEIEEDVDLLSEEEIEEIVNDLLIEYDEDED